MAGGKEEQEIQRRNSTPEAGRQTSPERGKKVRSGTGACSAQGRRASRGMRAEVGAR